MRPGAARVLSNPRNTGILLQKVAPLLCYTSLDPHHSNGSMCRHGMLAGGRSPRAGPFPYTMPSILLSGLCSCLSYQWLISKETPHRTSESLCGAKIQGTEEAKRSMITILSGSTLTRVYRSLKLQEALDVQRTRLYHQAGTEPTAAGWLS